MKTFVDPRDSPSPEAHPPLSRTTPEIAELKELHELCHAGRLYAVERWISEGRPLQLEVGVTTKGRRIPTALEIGIEKGNHALVHVLLCNGYDPRLEPQSPLDLALSTRRMDLVDLLLEWGADPCMVDPDEVFATYHTPTFERFRALGLDFTVGHALAYALSEHTSNKPLLGYCKRHRNDDPRIQTDLNIALGYHAGRGNEKGLQLCLWAGADPHASAPVLRWFWQRGSSDDEDDDDELRHSAIEEACQSGHAEILARLGPDPSKDNFDELYRWARSRAIVDVLARRALPKDMDSVIRSLMWWAAVGLNSDWQALDAVERLFALGARWRHGSANELADFRRTLLGLPNQRLIDWMRLLAKDDYCAPEILKELARTPAMRRRMKEVGFIPGGRDRRGVEVYRPTGSRDVLKRFEVELPKEKVETKLPSTVWIGTGYAGGEEVRLTRKELFDRLWTQPTSKLAAEWGISGPGLAKACKRLKIPRPTRGDWAKLRAGQRVRRPKLPRLPAGQADEIVVCVRR